jgi:hypothetical protein
LGSIVAPVSILLAPVHETVIQDTSELNLIFESSCNTIENDFSLVISLSLSILTVIGDKSFIQAPGKNV